MERGVAVIEERTPERDRDNLFERRTEDPRSAIKVPDNVTCFWVDQ